MRTKKHIDPVDKIQDFQRSVLSQKPESQDMIHEVRMMNFKVRPISGDISDLDFSNTEFIDALWSLGKLDEFFQKEYRSIKSRQKGVFYRLIDDMRACFQLQLNKARIETVESSEKHKRRFEVEIIKNISLTIH